MRLELSCEGMVLLVLYIGGGANGIGLRGIQGFFKRVLKLQPNPIRILKARLVYSKRENKGLWNPLAATHQPSQAVCFAAQPIMGP
jgi:hypothetical protein